MTVEDEGDLRAAIVRVCRLLWERELIGGREGNVSARAGAGRLLVTPAGRSKRDLAPDDLVAVDLEGRRLAGAAGSPSSELELHLAAYAARPEIDAVVHAHPLAALAHVLAGRPLEITVPETGFALGAIVPVAPFAEPGSPAVGASVAPLLAAGHDVVLLDRHGAVAVGSDPLTAADLLETVERAARLSLWTRLLARP